MVSTSFLLALWVCDSKRWEVFEQVPVGTILWAALLARISGGFSLVCPTCPTPLTFNAFLTDPVPISQVLTHIGEPTSPPLPHLTRGSPQAELDMGCTSAEADEAAGSSFS